MTDLGAVYDLYLRVSDLTSDDLGAAGEIVTLQEHQRLLEAEAVRLGYLVGKVIVENDMAGGKPKPASAFKRKRVKLKDGSTTYRVVRPGFTQLVDRIRSRQSVGFLAMDLDRVVRDPRDLEDLIDVVEETKANVRSMSGSIQFTNGGNDAERAMARIMVAIANKSSSDTRRRVQIEKARQAREGIVSGGPRPFGFEPDGVTVRDTEANLIRQWSLDILREPLIRRPGGILKSSPSSLTYIAKRCAEQGTAKPRKGPWTAHTIRTILLRPRNAGIMVHRGEEVGRAPWAPIVPVDIYRAVVSILTDPERNVSPGRAPKWLGSGIYLCNCGGIVTVQAHGNQKTKRPVYICRYKRLPGPHTTRDCEYLDEHVEDLVIGWANRADAVYMVTPVAPEVDLHGLRVQEASLVEKQRQYVRDELDGAITRAQLIEATSQINTRLGDVRKQLASASPASSPLAELVLAQNVRAKWETFDINEKRDSVAELLHVRILPTTRGNGGKIGPRLQVAKALEVKLKLGHEDD